MPTSEQGDNDSGGVRSVQRAVEIMSLLTEQRPTVTIREIVEATALPKTTVLRIVQTLEHSGLLSATQNGYVAGPGLWRWAHLAKNSWEPPEETRALMRELVARQRETVNIYVIHNTARVCVAQEESPMPLRHVVHVGDELPLWAGASSKVLLRDASDGLLEQIARSAPGGGEHMSVMRAEISSAAQAGYGVSHGEREVGLSAVAVPIVGRNGDVVASLSFSGPTSRFPDDRTEELIADLQWAARQLTERGFDHPLRSPLVRRRVRSS
ncbi:MAG TPA: IclR family transcriptional regulator [Jiangellaceae bacterium]